MFDVLVLGKSKLFIPVCACIMHGFDTNWDCNRYSNSGNFDNKGNQNTISRNSGN